MLVRAVRTVVAVVAALGVVAIAAGSFFAGRATLSESRSGGVDLHGTAGVVTAIREVSRLETTSFHIEKVVEATDTQSQLWGLVRAKDALLLVAVGDVEGGVDLSKMSGDDVRIDRSRATVHIRLPPPEILACNLDEHATHVYSRSTDTLAARNDQLEGSARKAAEEQIRKAALDAGILGRARTGAERTLRTLLGSFGFTEVDFDWGDSG